ncbi:hypothetical protein HDU86_003595 [Geranomyces michiganensis]|nr:hypothetical protein HDU86_003595 [Geranomyces michiganensis]
MAIITTTTTTTTSYSAAATLFLALAASTATVVHAHMMVSSPAVWGLVDELENPLPANGEFLCHGKKYDAQRPALSLTPNGKLALPITCGAAARKPENAKQICGPDPSAIHGGGGCILSIARTHNPKPEDFYVISSVHNCPTLEFGNINFNLPDLPACNDCTCQWNWISDVALDESYSNCFSCTVNGGKNGTITGGKRTPYYAVQGYPAKSPKPVYKNVFPDGAIPVTLTLTGGVNITSLNGNSTTTTANANATTTGSAASATATVPSSASSSIAWTSSSTRSSAPLPTAATAATGAQSSASRLGFGIGSTVLIAGIVFAALA